MSTSLIGTLTNRSALPIGSPPQQGRLSNRAVYPIGPATQQVPLNNRSVYPIGPPTQQFCLGTQQVRLPQQVRLINRSPLNNRSVYPIGQPTPIVPPRHPIGPTAPIGSTNQQVRLPNMSAYTIGPPSQFHSLHVVWFSDIFQKCSMLESPPARQ